MMGKRKDKILYDGFEQGGILFYFLHKDPNEEDLKIAKYRWEFLRRNQEYQNDYKELSPNKYDAICEKWKILQVMNPKYTFDEYLRVIVGKYQTKFHSKDSQAQE
jgi:hypothetical protein